MKTFKKAFALILTLAIVMSLGITAFAADGDTTVPSTYKITVDNPSAQVSIKNQKVTAYKVLDLDWDGDKAYTYTPTAGMAAYSYTPTEANNPGKVTTPVTTANLVEYLESIKSTPLAVAAFAKDLQANQTCFKSLKKVTETASNEKVDLDVTDLGLGYYLVAVTPVGSDATHQNTPLISVSLDTTAYNATVYVKSEAPALDKTVKDANGNYGDAAVSAEVGSNVSFQLKTKVPNTNGYTKYVFDVVDTLSAGLKLDAASFVVTIGGTTMTKDTNYTVATETVATNKTKFTLKFGDDFIQFMNAYNQAAQKGAYHIAVGDDIVIQYNAKVTAAGLTTNHQDNTAQIVYSNDPTIESDGSTGTGKTPEEKVHVYEFGLNLDKVDADATSTKLEGAIFTLKNNDTAKKYYKYDASTGSVSWVDTAAKATQLYSKGGKLYEYDTTTSTAGKDATTFKGLKAGTYHIEELTAPEGYAKIADTQVVIAPVANTSDNTISKATYTFTGGITGTLDANTGNVFTPSLQVGNHAGNKLPSTGGMGTTIFYTVGAIMMVSALVLLITKKKMSA